MQIRSILIEKEQNLYQIDHYKSEGFWWKIYTIFYEYTW
jgi:hypothetical protein